MTAPCPFCGNDHIILSVDLSRVAPRYQVLCLECLARGPVETTISEATEAWRRRHMPELARKSSHV